MPIFNTTTNRPIYAASGLPAASCECCGPINPNDPPCLCYHKFVNDNNGFPIKNIPRKARAVFSGIVGSGFCFRNSAGTSSERYTFTYPNLSASAWDLVWQGTSSRCAFSFYEEIPAGSVRLETFPENTTCSGAPFRNLTNIGPGVFPGPFGGGTDYQQITLSTSETAISINWFIRVRFSANLSFNFTNSLFARGNPPSYPAIPVASGNAFNPMVVATNGIAFSSVPGSGVFGDGTVNITFSDFTSCANPSTGGGGISIP